MPIPKWKNTIGCTYYVIIIIFHSHSCNMFHGIWLVSLYLPWWQKSVLENQTKVVSFFCFWQVGQKPTENLHLKNLKQVMKLLPVLNARAFMGDMFASFLATKSQTFQNIYFPNIPQSKLLSQSSYFLAIKELPLPGRVTQPFVVVFMHLLKQTTTSHNRKVEQMPNHCLTTLAMR